MLIVVLCICAGVVMAQDPKDGGKLREMGQNAYQVGEELEYRIRYGPFRAGIARIGIQEETMRSGRDVMHVVATGRTVGMAEIFFRTRDRYETFFDPQALVPWEFIRDVDEGGYTKDYHLIFNQRKQKVRDINNPEKGVFDYEPYAQDMLSAMYYARSIDTDTLEAGDLVTFTMFLDHETFPFRLRLLGREEIKTKLGRMKCLVLRPSLQEGRVFKDKESMTIYVSDDPNKIPVLVQSDLRVGSIKVEITGAKGLRHKLKTTD